jgi:hypothetical protein
MDELTIRNTEIMIIEVSSEKVKQIIFRKCCDFKDCFSIVFKHHILHIKPRVFLGIEFGDMIDSITFSVAPSMFNDRIQNVLSH